MVKKGREPTLYPEIPEPGRKREEQDPSPTTEPHTLPAGSLWVLFPFVSNGSWARVLQGGTSSSAHCLGKGMEREGHWPKGSVCSCVWGAVRKTPASGPGGRG